MSFFPDRLNDGWYYHEYLVPGTRTRIFLGKEAINCEKRFISRRKKVLFGQEKGQFFPNEINLPAIITNWELTPLMIILFV